VVKGDYKNLLKKAEHNCEIAEVAKNKSYYDVAVSRFYYSVYLKIIFILKCVDENYKPDNTGGSHIQTSKEFISVAHNNYLKVIGITGYSKLDFIYSLTKMRKKSDYDVEITKKSDFENVFMKQYMSVDNTVTKIIDNLEVK
jgi:uncharacterized protein (UPF0332 family)